MNFGHLEEMVSGQNSDVGYDVGYLNLKNLYGGQVLVEHAKRKQIEITGYPSPPMQRL